jgi:hypothetical protein
VATPHPAPHPPVVLCCVVLWRTHTRHNCQLEQLCGLADTHLTPQRSCLRERAPQPAPTAGTLARSPRAWHAAHAQLAPPRSPMPGWLTPPAPWSPVGLRSHQGLHASQHATAGRRSGARHAPVVCVARQQPAGRQESCQRALGGGAEVLGQHGGCGASMAGGRHRQAADTAAEMAGMHPANSGSRGRDHSQWRPHGLSRTLKHQGLPHVAPRPSKPDPLLAHLAAASFSAPQILR